VPVGQFLAIVGANGSGKTTLVKHFNGLLRPRRGRLTIMGKETASQSVGSLARTVGFLFQHPEQQIFSSTVYQEIAFGPRNLDLPQDEVARRVDDVLTRFDLAGLADRPPAILGYGLRRRITLASLAAMDPPIVVLDEPTVGLDASGRRETFEWLTELHAQGRTIVLVSHDMALVARYAQRAIVLHKGQIVADDAPAEVFAQSEILASASLTPPPVLCLARALRPWGMRGSNLTVAGFCDEYLNLWKGRQ
jgi:energy-coupling factor transport system ATP-binding protein